MYASFSQLLRQSKNSLCSLSALFDDKSNGKSNCPYNTAEGSSCVDLISSHARFEGPLSKMTKLAKSIGITFARVSR